MADMDSFVDIMVHANRLWLTDQHAEALKLLDEWIAKGERTTEATWLRLHACLIAEDMNDLALVRRYCEQVLSFDPNNTLAMYTLADAMFRQGEVDLAIRQAARAYSLVRHSSDEVDRGLLELLTKRWPEIKRR